MIIRFSTVFHLIFANWVFKNFCPRYRFFAKKIEKMTFFCTKVFILFGLKFGRNLHFFTKKSKKTWIFSIKTPMKNIEKNEMKIFFIEKARGGGNLWHTYLKCILFEITQKKWKNQNLTNIQTQKVLACLWEIFFTVTGK